jgi:hypothetical protein
MQPYFAPYAGYFRLLAAADMFVAYDCVQFPRRGWAHRNRLNDAERRLQWLTLPLKKGDRDTTRICDLEFRADGGLSYSDCSQRFPALARLNARYPDLTKNVFTFDSSPVDYLVSRLKEISALLGIECPIILSSGLDIPADLKAQDRIIAIARQLGATSYINPPGGRELYSEAAFREAGLRLHFLSSYEGDYSSILERLANEEPAEIAAEIQRNLILDPPL